jgi:hypothetical protein
MDSPKKKVVASTTTNEDSRLDFTQRQRKVDSILQAFFNGRSLNRFEAEVLHDHCLNTTVSIIGKLGVAIQRKRERVPCKGGKATVSVNRYWLDTNPENILKTREYLTSRGVIK